MGIKKKKTGIEKFEPIFGKWYVLQEIGRGSYGTVYKIFKTENGKKEYSALKHIHIGPIYDSDKLLAIGDAYQYYKSIFEETRKRIELVRSLNGNANIVPIEEYVSYGSEDGLSWDILIRMKLLIPITDHFVNNPPSENDIRKLGMDICSALEACESKNIAHLDVKANNIYINDLGNYMLGDFGAAKVEDIEREQSTLILEDLALAAPEDEHMSRSRHMSADLYSLGMMLYQYLNDNKAPFVSNDKIPYTYSLRERAILQSGEPILPPRNASSDFAKVILKAVAHSPNERYASATDMKYALEGIVHASNVPLWTEESRVSHIVKGDTDVHKSNLPLKGSSDGKSKSSAERIGGDDLNSSVVDFRDSRIHRISVSDRAGKRIRRIINWILFTCLLSMIPLFIYLLLRWLFIEDAPVKDKLAMELLYLALTLAIVSLRELIRYDSKKKHSIVFQPALWLIIVDLFLSAMLFCVMTANELGLFSEPVQSPKMLLAAIILSGTSFILGTAIQYWEDY